jgi:peptidoglycan hydrolase-like protein with peptidoglycan-binding domain
MNHATRVALALVLGGGLATAAQAQDTYSQGAAPKSQSAAPAMNDMQNAAPAARTQRANPGRMHKASGPTQKMNRHQVKMVQQKLKSEGLYRGRIDGVMGPQTRLAMTRSQKEAGSSPTASMGRKGFGQQKSGRGQPDQAGLGVGSSMPNNPDAMNNPNTALTPSAPPTNQTTTGAGGSTAPSNPTAKY